VNSFSFCYVCGGKKSAEIPESERFLKASSTNVSYRRTLKGNKKTVNMSVKDKQVCDVLQQNLRAKLRTGNT
jgi:hypothetical protein